MDYRHRAYQKRSALLARKSLGSLRGQSLGFCMALNSASLAEVQKLDGQPVDLMNEHSSFNVT